MEPAADTSQASDSPRSGRLLEHLPWIVAGVVFLSVLGAVGWSCHVRNEGHLVYTLDDAYIHLAMARNLATRGVFGVTPHEFSSSTSSPVWTVLEAATFRLLGSTPDWVGGLWAAACGVFALYAVSLIGLQFGLGPVARGGACLAVLLLAPLVPLTSTGMEHCLHVALVILLLVYVVRLLETPTRGALVGMCLTAVLAGGTRYETLFLVGPLALVLFWHRQWRAGLLLVGSACLLPVVFALYSVAHGSYPLPNSLMLKGRFHDVADGRSLYRFLGGFALRQLLRNPELQSVCLVLGAVQFAGRGRRPALGGLGFALAATLLLHLQLARVGWFYRYEAYIIAAAVAVATVTFVVRVRDSEPATRWARFRPLLVGCVALIAAVPLFTRAVRSIREVVTASRNIYEQPYQTAHFVAQELGPGARVALTDLGAVSFYSQAYVLDLWGLGSIDVARLRRSGRFDTNAIAALLRSHRIEYVIVFPSSFQGATALPEGLVEVGRWTISNNVVCGGETVGFFATSNESAWRLRTAFDRHARLLPAGVRIERMSAGSAGPN